jgi:hypothetical protein
MPRCSVYLSIEASRVVLGHGLSVTWVPNTWFAVLDCGTGRRVSRAATARLRYLHRELQPLDIPGCCAEMASSSYLRMLVAQSM